MMPLDVIIELLIVECLVLAFMKTSALGSFKMFCSFADILEANVLANPCSNNEDMAIIIFAFHFINIPLAVFIAFLVYVKQPRYQSHLF
jgi:hypothetical protein